MYKKDNPKRRMRFSLPLLIIIITAILIPWGCKNYDDPAKNAVTNTGSVLIDAPTLKSWLDRELVNSDEKFEKVVILDVTSSSEYAKGHIPGAQLLNSSSELFSQDRIEGPAKGINMILEGSRMDTILQSHGINERTTIVITSTQNDVTLPCRAYFNFRYWGFSKEKLKFLDGLNSAWSSAGYELETKTPGITPSTYSVKKIATFNPDQRVSLDEMITAVRDNSGIPWDTRFDGPLSGFPITTGALGSSKYVVFEGIIKGGKLYAFTNLINGLIFKDADTISTALIAAGIDGSTGKIIYPYCRTGVFAAVGYFALDAILGWKAMLYDGSWSQWGQMSSDIANGGVLPSGSPWATDNANLTDNLYYNVGKTISASSSTVLTTANIETLVLAGFGSENQIEKEDFLYIQSGGGSSAGTGTASSGGYGQ